MLTLILGAVSAYRLWGDMTWLSVVTILLTIGLLSVQNEEENNGHGIMFTILIMIFIYSFLR